MLYEAKYSERDMVGSKTNSAQALSGHEKGTRNSSPMAR